MATKTRPPRKPVNVTSPTATAEGRAEVRNRMLQLKSSRQFHPLTHEVLRDACVEEYREVLDSALESGKCSTIKVNLSFAFLRHWMRANGANRSRKWSHVKRLAAGFRPTLDEEGNVDHEAKTGFDTSCTHFVVSTNGMVTNGGHSGAAAGVAFYPPSIFEAGDDGEPPLGFMKDKEGNVTDEPHLPPMPSDFPWVGEFDEDGNYIADTDFPIYRELVDLTATLVVNAPDSSVLKMDDVRLAADFADYLEMIDAIRKWIEDSILDADTLGQIGRGWYLRTLCKADDDGKVTQFGSLRKGGKLTKSDVTVWFTVFLPMLEESIAMLRNDTGSIVLSNELSDKLSLKDIIVGMLVADSAGRKRIANALTASSEFGKWLCSYCTKPLNEPKWVKPTGDRIISALAMYSRTGKVAETKEYIETKELDAHSFIEGRANGWDRGEDEAGEDLHEVSVTWATVISDLIGDDTLEQNAKMKATRAGKGKRGRNAKK